MLALRDKIRLRIEVNGQKICDALGDLSYLRLYVKASYFHDIIINENKNNRTSCTVLPLDNISEEELAGITGEDNLDFLPLSKRLDAWIWLAAIWVSNDRLPSCLTPETIIQLRYWPNLTRVPDVKNAIRICSMLSRMPVKPKFLVSMLGISRPSVSGVLSALYAQGCLNYSKHEDLIAKSSTQVCVESLQSEPINSKATYENNDYGVPSVQVDNGKRTLLSRLLSKLKLF